MNTAPSAEAPEVINQPSIQNHSFQRKHIKSLVVIILLFIVIPVSVFVLRQQGHVSQVKEFTLIESSPTDQTNNFSPVGQPTFVFSKPLSVKESDLRNYFHMSPSVSGSWHIEKNKQVVYFESNKTQQNNFPETLDYNTVYTVTISHSLRATSSQTLKKDHSIAFRTKQPLAFNFSLSKKLVTSQLHKTVTVPVRIDSYSQSPVPLSLSEGSTVNVGVYVATEQQLLQYFAYKDTNFPLYQFTYSNENKLVRRLQATIEQNLDGSSDVPNGQKMDLPADAFPVSGIYFVTVANNLGHDDFFVTVSNHVNQVFTDDVSSFVWTTDMSGKSMSGVQAVFYKDNGSPKQIDSVSTGNDGLGKTNHGSTAIDFVITKKGDDRAVAFTSYYGPFYNRPYGSTSRYSVFSYTDRPVYRPGDKVYYKAILRKDENGTYTIPKETFYMKDVYDYSSDDTDANYKPVTSDAHGTITTDFTLPQMLISQSPTLYLATKDRDGKYTVIDSLSVAVISYRKPDMEVTVTTPETEYVSSDSAHMTVIAKTNYGEPLANVSFSYRLLGNDYTEVQDRSTERLDESISSWYGTGNELASGTGHFDEKGIAHITVPATLPSSFEQSQLATIEITPNIGAVPSIGKIARLIHRGTFALFFGDISADTKNGIAGTLRVFDHSSPRKPVEKQSVTVSLYKTIDYNTKELVEEHTATASADGTIQFSFSKKETGNYELVAKATDSRSNTVTTKATTYIGEQYVYQQDADRLDISAQKNNYSLGETANVSLDATFPLSEAVTVLSQNNGATSHIVSVVRNDINAQTLSLPVLLQKDFGQGVGVDVYTVYNGKVIGNHTNISISQTKKKLHASVSFNKQFYHPGDTVKATIVTKDDQGQPVSADNSLAIIDASILQIGQLPANLFDRFYSTQSYSPPISHYDSTTGIMTNLGGGGGGCFLSGTQILMSNGTTKPIENVRVGDSILTRSSDMNGNLITDRVIQTYRHAVTDYVTINNRLNVTFVHRIFLNHEWHEVKDAKVGDTLIDETGNDVKITSITYHTGQFAVYNLTTKNLHTFFADGIYVHNDKGGGTRTNFVDTVYWNPHIQTDTDGKATVSFPLPDNLTTFTAQVFSNTADNTFGETVNSFLAKKDISILPALANFYYSGDTPTVSALIQNSTQNDGHFTIALAIPELNYKKTQAVMVSKNDFTLVKFPVSMQTTKDTVSVTIRATNEKGDEVDSVLLKKPVLPKGNIISTWHTMTGSKDVIVQATYPTLDFNTVSVFVSPNIASRLFTNNIYIAGGVSSSTGIDIFSYSYILARTRDGGIAPTAYHYAKMKNDFREAVSSVLDDRTQGGYWQPTEINSTESLGLINLWLMKGFEQAESVGMLSGITNVPSIISSAKAFPKTTQNTDITIRRETQLPSFIPPPPPPPPLPSITISLPPPPSDVQNFQSTPVASASVQGAKTKRVLAAEPTLPPHLFFQPFTQQAMTPSELFIREWELHEAIPDGAYGKSAQSLAVKALQGVATAIGELRKLQLPSAADRMVWDSDTEEGRIFPAITMIEKGSMRDADAAVKGLSVSESNITTSSLALYAGVKYAERKHIYLDNPEITVLVNSVPIIHQKSNQFFENSLSQTVPLKNTPNGKITLSVKADTDTPVYTSYVQTDYNPSGSAEHKESVLTQVLHFLSHDSDSSTQERNMDLHITRVFKNIFNGGEIPSISAGETGIVTLSGDNPFFKMAHSDSYDDSVHMLFSTDAVSPAYQYMDQFSMNSPKYQSVLERIFPNVKQPNQYGNSYQYIAPSDYSDEAVFYNSAINLNLPKFILPYVAYGVSSGTYYQPKTTVVFPYLGVTSQEK